MLRADTLSIGQIAKRTGLSVTAIRHYEAEGLIHPIRSVGGTRHFRRADIRRLSFVRLAQKLGLSLAEIRDHLAPLPIGAAPTKADWEAASRAMRGALSDRIAALEALRDTLDGCIGCGCLSLEVCALYNPGDQAARLGDGPRYLMGDRPNP